MKPSKLRGVKDGSGTSARAAAGGVPAAEALSFLKDTRGLVSWMARDLAETLKIKTKEAEQVLTILELQGYAKRMSGKNGEWMTTPAGEAVSGSKPPRYSRESVEEALGELKKRIKALNGDSGADFKVRAAVAFGDFLSGRARVQAADVGVELVRRDPKGREEHSAVEQGLRREALRKLRERSALVNLRGYEQWMGHRRHRRLV